MKNKFWVKNRNQWKEPCFVIVVLLLIDKFQVSRSSENDILPGVALPYEKIAEVGGIEESAIDSSEINIETDENSTRPWVPKCCNLNYGFTFEKRSNCVETEDEFLPDFEDRPDYSETVKDWPVITRFEYLIGDPCQYGKYILDPTAYPDDKFSIFTNGTLLYLDQLYSKGEFCLETLNGTIRAFICFGAGKPEYELDFTNVIYAIALLISIPFLLATAIVYLSMGMFRDLRGKSLSCHALCLAVGYLALATVQLASDQLDEGLCVAAGFIIQFFFVSSFFWLNVICFDTWRSIKNDLQHRPRRASSEKIIFWCYSLYGWYAPTILSIVTLIMDLEPAIPESFLKPNFGLRSCWFYSDDAALPYFYAPVAFLIGVNVVFFIMSARLIYLEQKKRREELNGNSLEEPLLLIRIYMKTLQECIYLFCIMGLNWAAEVISWAAHGSQMIWVITDIFNALQGIMIFYLFVVRPTRVRYEVKRKISMFWKRIIKCNYQYEREEIKCDKELQEFLPQSNGTAV